MWECFLVSHHPAKFGGDRHCGSGDIKLLAGEEENFNPSLLFISKRHGLKESTRHIRSSTPILVTKQLLPVCLKALMRRRKREKDKRKAIAKCFALHANAISYQVSIN